MDVVVGGGCFPDRPSPASSRAVLRFLQHNAGIESARALEPVKRTSVRMSVEGINETDG